MLLREGVMTMKIRLLLLSFLIILIAVFGYVKSTYLYMPYNYERIEVLFKSDWKDLKKPLKFYIIKYGAEISENRYHEVIDTDKSKIIIDYLKGAKYEEEKPDMPERAKLGDSYRVSIVVITDGYDGHEGAYELIEFTIYEHSEYAFVFTGNEKYFKVSPELKMYIMNLI